MLIAVMSDTHNNKNSLLRAINIINKRDCSVLIHCGDYTSTSTILEFKDFSGNIYGVFGNMDKAIAPVKHMVMEELGNLKLMGIEGKVELGGKRIAFTHYPDIAHTLARSGKYDVVFFGHTHRFEVDKDSYNTPLINPGEIMGRSGKSSFIFYDLESGEIEAVELS